MTSSRLFRSGGLALLGGAVVFIIHLVARSMITAGQDPILYAQEDSWAAINVLGVVGATLVLLGLPALYVRMAGSTGVLGVIGVVLVALAWLFFGIFLSFYGVLVMPWLASDAPSLIATGAALPAAILIAFIVGLVVELTGTLLLAIPFVRGREQPTWIGYMLLVAALLRVAGNFLAPSGPASNFALNLLSNLGPVLFLIAVGYLGLRMWQEDAPGRQVEAREHHLFG